MKIWIAGASGMLGSAFAKALPEADTTRIEITDRKAVEEHLKEKGITHMLNCTGYTAVDKAESEPDLAFRINAEGTGNLAAASKNCGVHLTHFSTDYVFDGKASTPYKEEALCHPLNVYGMSKWEGEKTLPTSACCIRTSWLFGHGKKNFVETILLLMQEKEVLPVLSDQEGRPTFCKDLVEATLKILGKEGVYHFANKGSITRFGFAQEIRRAALSLGIRLKTDEICPISTADYPLPAKRPAYSVLDTTKIEPFAAPRPWQDALFVYLRERMRSCA